MDVSKLMFRDGLMAGERILVTGGGTGLGREMAEALPQTGRHGLYLRAAAEQAGRDRSRTHRCSWRQDRRHGLRHSRCGCDPRDGGRDLGRWRGIDRGGQTTLRATSSAAPRIFRSMVSTPSPIS